MGLILMKNCQCFFNIFIQKGISPQFGGKKRQGNVSVMVLVFMASIAVALSTVYYIAKWEYVVDKNYKDAGGLYTASADGARKGASTIYALLMAHEHIFMEAGFQNPSQFEYAWKQAAMVWLNTNKPDNFSYTITKSDGAWIEVTVEYKWRYNSGGYRYNIVSTAENQQGIRSRTVCEMAFEESFVNIIESGTSLDYNDEHVPACYYQLQEKWFDFFWLYEDHS